MLIPFYKLGPGDSIKEELEYYNWSQSDFAEILGKSEKFISQLLNNKIPITLDLATELSEIFKQSPEFWLELDIKFRLQSKKIKPGANLKVKSEIFQHMPISDMRNRNWIPQKTFKFEALEEAVINFWNKPDLDNIFSFLKEEASHLSPAHFRKSSTGKLFSPFFALTWLHKAKEICKSIPSPVYNEKMLIDIFHKINTYTIVPNGVEIFLNDITNAGVKFIVLHHLPKTYIDGASFYSNKNPVIIYSQRFDRIDNFWFTIAHEIAHILLHFNEPKTFFIDCFDSDYSENYKEKEADNYAEKVLLTKQIMTCFKERSRITDKHLTFVSDLLEISEAVIIGCLHHHGILSYRQFRSNLTKISDFIPKQYYRE